MARAIVTCGKLCSGKTTYARRLCGERNAVLLSVDEMMLTLFPEGAGEAHDLYAERTQQYLLELSLRILRTGRDAVLDWGLWTRERRSAVRDFYARNGEECEIRYLHISDAEWERRIRKRNEGKDAAAYAVDEGLLQKFRDIFEEPEAAEIDMTVEA